MKISKEEIKEEVQNEMFGGPSKDQTIIYLSELRKALINVMASGYDKEKLKKKL